MKLVEMEHFMVAPDLSNIKTTAMHTTLDPTIKLDAVTAFGTKKAIKIQKAAMLERVRRCCTSSMFGFIVILMCVASQTWAIS